MLALFGVSAAGLQRAAAQPTRGKTLVVLFLRGGVDGLALVPPVGDPAYAGLRPGLKVSAADKAPQLDDTFCLHPALAALQPLYAKKRLAVLHAVGQDKPSRSHFDAQDFLEFGMAGRRANDGWMNRSLGALGVAPSAFRAVALQNQLPIALQGDGGAVAFPSLTDFSVKGSASGTFEALYAGAVDTALRTSGQEAFESMAAAKEQGLATAPPRNGAQYPNSPLARRLQDIARLVHGDVGLTLAATEQGGFDTHLGEGGAKGQLATRLGDVGDALAAFATDLGERLDDVVLTTVTEFGRTARENGTRGTDHGTASAMLVLGGAVRGGQVFTDWPGLSPQALHEGRDLRVTTDVRSVLGQLLAGHLRLSSAALAQVFPDGPAVREGQLFAG
jgi:uncharacterized protein (DUF1501 family)